MLYYGTACSCLKIRTPLVTARDTWSCLKRIMAFENASVVVQLQIDLKTEPKTHKLKFDLDIAIMFHIQIMKKINKLSLLLHQSTFTTQGKGTYKKWQSHSNNGELKCNTSINRQKLFQIWQIWSSKMVLKFDLDIWVFSIWIRNSMYSTN